MLPLRVIAFAVATCLAMPAWASDGEPLPSISRPRRVAAVLAALGPGLVLRGAGSWVAGEPTAAKRLAATAAIGLAIAATGGAPIGWSGANPYSIAPGVPMVVSGAGALLATWWADIAVAAGLARTGSARELPPWSIELATLWLHDAVRERGLARLEARLELGRIGAAGAAMVDAENRARGGELSAHLWIAGEPTGRPGRPGDRLLLRATGRIDRDDDDRVTLSTAELELAGRLDLGWLDGALAGTFAELSTGLGATRASYAGGHDDNSILLAGFAWGVYLARHGEARVFYDHRRDSLTGGLAAGPVAGFIGSFGGGLDVSLAPRWAVRGQVEYGNAWLTTLALRYQGGAP